MMCGIAGVYGYNAIRLSLLITLGQLDRGTLGTGVAFQNNNKVKIVKEPIHPIKFVRKYYGKFDTKIKVAISHNRQPSRGNVSYFNTHPFMDCNRQFALIHNGSCSLEYSITKTIKNKHRILGETDSELICHALEEFYNEYNDMIKAIEELFSIGFQGAILIVTKDGKIHGARKGMYPLHYCVTSKHVFLASESEAIENVLEENVKIIPLKSKQIIEVDRGNVQVYGKGEDEIEQDIYVWFRSLRCSNKPYWYMDNLF
jgi:glucosamine--fructose-6-phosphate aminotransferase (isomerizing)